MHCCVNFSMNFGVDFTPPMVHGILPCINIVFSYVEPRMGKRKLRFFVTKNYERKKYAARMPQTPSLEGSATSSLMLTVSTPFSAFTAAPVSNIAQLHSRVTAANGLPQNWVNMSASTLSTPVPSLLFCQLQCPPPLFHSQVAYNVQVDQHLKWTLTIFSNCIENDQCSLLATFPSKLTNVDDVVALLQKIDGRKICTGNPDQWFICLTERQGRVLLDQSGKNDCP